MEIKVVEESKSKIVFEVHGAGHTLANTLEKELWQDKEVKAAGYFVEHPLVGVPRVVVETTSKKSARAAVEAAVERLKKQSSEFEKAFKKLK